MLPNQKVQRVLKPGSRILLPNRARQISEGGMSVSSTDGLYSIIPPLFDPCGDNDLVSLSLAGVSPFLDWLGWQSSDVYRLVHEFIVYNRAAYANCVKSPGWLADPCADPNGIESLFAELVIEGFGSLGRMGPVRDVSKAALNYCEKSPRFRIDGLQISDDLEYDIVRATEVLIQDLLSLAITGNHSTAGQFDGLENLVIDTYSNSILNSIVVDWNSNDLDGGSGVTWNGAGIASTVDFVSLLMALVRSIRQRINLVPSIRSGGFQTGDLALVMPGSYVGCLLNEYTCWSVCAGDYALMNTFEARRFRDALNGGMFGAGQITIEGVTIPILPVDQLINGDGTFDVYLLSRGVGNWRWLYGQYNNMNLVAPLASSKTGLAYSALDGGRIMQWTKAQNLCLEQIVEMQPRIVLEAPWAQVRIQNVTCNIVGSPFSGDPNSYYFPYYYDCDRQ
jgi:hypothetical protein